MVAIFVCHNVAVIMPTMIKFMSCCAETHTHTSMFEWTFVRNEQTSNLGHYLTESIKFALSYITKSIHFTLSLK